MQLVLMGGSLRSDSLNGRLLGYLASELGSRGHETRSFSGTQLRFPLFEEGLAPSNELAVLHAALGSAQGLVIVSPEYNAGIPGHLKNAVDWLSTMKPSPWVSLPVLTLRGQSRGLWRSPGPRGLAGHSGQYGSHRPA